METENERFQRRIQRQDKVSQYVATAGGFLIAISVSAFWVMLPDNLKWLALLALTGAITLGVEVFQRGLRKIVNAPKPEVDRCMEEEEAKIRAIPNNRKVKETPRN